MPARPLSSAEAQMGYKDAVDLGTQLAAQQGYTNTEIQSMEQIGPNIFRVRFGLMPKESGRFLDLYFDSLTRKVIQSQEIRETFPDAGVLWQR
jgi:hypothetical protein